ncbi:10 kDa chaperonin [candidate division SR1 bacterium]|nr:10 kDa chaperonin [candidate division SR1 bacterium]
MVLQPLEDHILIKPIIEETTTKSGIILPDSKEKPYKGKVIAVGAGKILENGNRSPVDVQIGDIVYFTQYAPDEIEVEENGEKVKYLVIKHSSLLAKQ